MDYQSAFGSAFVISSLMSPFSNFQHRIHEPFVSKIISIKNILL